MKRSASLVPLLLMSTAAVPLVAQTRLPKPVIGTPTVVVSGPSWLQAASDMPTWIRLRWPAVPNATNYVVLRSLDNIVFSRRYDVLPDPGNRDPQTGDYHRLDYGLDVNWTYWYQVLAVFADGTRSGTSPVASGKSVPYLAPTGLKYTVLASVAKPGQLRVTLSWDPVWQAKEYYFSLRPATGGLWSAEMPQTSVVVDDPAAVFPKSSGVLGFRLLPTQTFVACVSTIYPNQIRNYAVNSCTTIQL